MASADSSDSFVPIANWLSPAAMTIDGFSRATPWAASRAARTCSYSLIAFASSPALYAAFASSTSSRVDRCAGGAFGLRAWPKHAPETVNDATIARTALLFLRRIVLSSLLVDEVDELLGLLGQLRPGVLFGDLVEAGQCLGHLAELVLAYAAVEHHVAELRRVGVVDEDPAVILLRAAEIPDADVILRRPRQAPGGEHAVGVLLREALEDVEARLAADDLRAAHEEQC